MLVVDVDLMVANHSVALYDDHFHLAFYLAIELCAHLAVILDHSNDVCALGRFTIKPYYAILRGDHGVVASADSARELKQLQTRVELDCTLVFLTDQVDRDLVPHLSANGIAHHLHVTPRGVHREGLSLPLVSKGLELVEHPPVLSQVWCVLDDEAFNLSFD